MLRLGKKIERFLQRRSHTVTIGVQVVVADGEGRVLLVRHRYKEGWHFPGGGVERNETVERAIARELKEETGVVLSGRPRLFDIYSHFDAFPKDHIVLFVAESWTQPAVPRSNLEIAEQAFFALDALPSEITAGTRRRLNEVFAGAEHTIYW
jgi:ADP-ribose pyrophosphatase YjhB (NUDIX family)